MKRKDNVRYKRRDEAIFFVAIGVWFLFLSACVTTGTAPGRTDIKGPERAEEKSPLFQSENYVIYELAGGETPESLARRFLNDPKKDWVIAENNEGVSFEKGQLIVIPLKEERLGGLTVNGFQKVPVFVYHTFAENCKSSLCVPVRDFDRQMAYLKNNGYHVISLSDLIAFLEFKKSLPKKAVVITIDDGYKSAYDIAYPILKKYGFSATLFIYLDFIGMPKSSVTWEELEEMKENGFEVGSHTLSHCNLTKKLTGESEVDYLKRVEKELVSSKMIIDKKLNQDTTALAFPYGVYNPQVLALCKKAGYKLCLSVKRGGNPFFAYPLSLRRSQLLSGDLNYFIKNLDTFHNVSLR